MRAQRWVGQQMSVAPLPYWGFCSGCTLIPGIPASFLQRACAGSEYSDHALKNKEPHLNSQLPSALSFVCPNRISPILAPTTQMCRRADLFKASALASRFVFLQSAAVIPVKSLVCSRDWLLTFSRKKS